MAEDSINPRRRRGKAHIEPGRVRYRHHGGCRGDRVTSEYSSWRNMMSRCYDPGATRYENWGGRGVTVCERWRNDYSNFLADMGPKPSPKHSIERIRNDLGYEPGNCCWATPLQQNRNRRNTRTLTIDGRTKTLQEWADETGLTRNTLQFRLKRGNPVDASILRPAGVKLDAGILKQAREDGLHA